MSEMMIFTWTWVLTSFVEKK